MGIAFLSLFLANNLIGWLGRFYGQTSPANFWICTPPPLHRPGVC
jgi:hypothetical protein